MGMEMGEKHRSVAFLGWKWVKTKECCIFGMEMGEKHRSVAFWEWKWVKSIGALHFARCRDGISAYLLICAGGIAAYLLICAAALVAARRSESCR